MGSHNRKLTLHASLIIIFFMIATNTQSGWLFLIISLMTAALVVNIILPRAVRKNSRIKVQMPSEMSVGEPTVLTITVSNTGRIPIMLLNLSIADLLTEQKITVQFLKKGEDWSMRIPVIPRRRGFFKTVKINVHCSAPFGIYSAWGTSWQLELVNPFVVLPKHTKLLDFAMPEHQSAELDTDISRQRRSQGSEYYGSREFRSEDSYRHIDWRSTARTNKLMVKEFERYMNAPVNIVLDLNDHISGNEPTFEELRETAIQCAMSLAEHAGSSGRGYSLISSGQQSEIVRPSDLREALYWGAGFETTDEGSLASVNRYGDQKLSRSINYIVFPTFKGTDPQALLELTLLKSHIVAIVIDARSFVEQPDPPDSLEFDEEAGEVRVSFAADRRDLKRRKLAARTAIDMTMEQFEIKHLVDVLGKSGIEALLVEKGCEIAECLQKPTSYIEG